MAIFLAGTKLSRIGIDIDRSTSSTVAERVRASVSTTSKSSGARRTGTPDPPRRTALCTVCRQVEVEAGRRTRRAWWSPRGRGRRPTRSAWWSPTRSRCIWENRSLRARCPSRRTPLGVSSVRPPCCSISPASGSVRASRASRSSDRAASSPRWRGPGRGRSRESAAGDEADCSSSSIRSSSPSWAAMSVASRQPHRGRRR